MTGKAGDPKVGDIVYIPENGIRGIGTYDTAFTRQGRLGVVEHVHDSSYYSEERVRIEVLVSGVKHRWVVFKWDVLGNHIAPSKRKTPIVEIGDIVYRLSDTGHDDTEAGELKVAKLPGPDRPFLTCLREDGKLFATYSWRRHAENPNPHPADSPEVAALKELAQRVGEKYVKMGHISSNMVTDMLRDAGLASDSRQQYATVSLTIPVDIGADGKPTPMDISALVDIVTRYAGANGIGGVELPVAVTPLAADPVTKPKRHMRARVPEPRKPVIAFDPLDEGLLPSGDPIRVGEGVR